MAAMRINRSSAVTPLAELKKNDTDLAKRLKVVASGQTLNSAGDGASNFAISERMRVRIRALGQDNDNVQTGMSLLRVAGGAVQEQINLMRTIKQKVIDANNDSNTDSDRETIQKEINQGYQQIQDIATDTTYNGRHLLLGGAYDRSVFSWEVKDHAVLVEGSDTLKIIHDATYDTLDEQEGPFAIFSENGTTDVDITYSGGSAAPAKPAPFGGFSTFSVGGPRRAPAASSSSTLISGTATNFSGATEDKPSVYEMDFSGYKNAAALNRVGVNIDGYSFTLANDTDKKNYASWDTVSIKGLTTTEQAIEALAKRINQTSASSEFKAERNGKKLKLTTVLKGADINKLNYTLKGWSAKFQAAQTGKKVAALDDADPTGLFSSPAYLTGGADQIGTPPTGEDKDANYTPAKTASLALNLSGAKAGQGITINPSGYSSTYIRFVKGNSTLTYLETSQYGRATYNLGLDGSFSRSFGNMTVTYKNHKLILTASRAGSSGNYNYVSDGAPGHTSYTSGSSPQYEAVKAYTGKVTKTQNASDGTKASYTIDLSVIPESSSSDDVESVIHDLRGKGAQHTYRYYPNTYSTYHYPKTESFEFIDSSDKRSLANTARLGGTAIDLAKLRSMVNKTTNIKQALQTLLTDSLTSYSAAVDKDGNVVLKSTQRGEDGDAETIQGKKGIYSSYDVDFNDYLKDHKVSDLVGKGFRWYCATDPGQWFNLQFTDGSPEEADRPKSGTATQDIKTITVDVSKAQDATDVVNAIYDQAMPLLTGSDPNYNHNYRVAADSASGVLTIYDKRMTNLKDTRVYPQRQEQGAKIADGVLDNVVKSKKDLLVDDLVIQHTDKANKNIHLRLARTTLDHIFQFRTDAHDISEYNVMTKDMREKLLGYQADDTHKATQGLLDRGIEYLTDAEVLIGAQSNHLEHAHDAIVTDEESTTASDSVIRDADMAKEMTNYMRANILTQTASAMTAQANQSSKNVLELL